MPLRDKDCLRRAFPDTTVTGGNDGALIPHEIVKRLDAHAVTSVYQNKQRIFAQGDKADSLFFIRSGSVKLTVTAPNGKKAVIAILQNGDFFGEGCLAKLSLRISTATAIECSTIARVKRARIASGLRKRPRFATFFISHLLDRITRVEEDLVDQIFSSSERRLARVLLQMAGFKES